MKLEVSVGKSYINRFGDIVDILEDDGTDHWPMIGKCRSNGNILMYQKNGEWAFPSDFDLIEEVNTDENERTT